MQIFEELSEDKQLRIINAGMEVFGKYDYKHANTELIASKAGISKGLLFYYFKNKQSFYLYLFQYCEKIVFRIIDKTEIMKIDDFYELLSYGAEKKLDILHQYPYIMDFILKAWLASQHGEIEGLTKQMNQIMDSTYTTWFSHINLAKFKDDVDPKRICQMMIWMMQGYLYELQLSRREIDIEVLMAEFREWSTMFKRFTYKDEYQS